MAGTLSEADAQRLARSGMPPLPVEQGLRLFDVATASSTATASGDPVVVAMRLNLPALAARGFVPTMLRGLVRAPARRVAAGTDGVSLLDRLLALPAEERQPTLLALVRDQVAAVLGHGGAESVEATQSFQDLGFDSLTAIELRNRLGVVSGLTLPATLVFDYPTPVALAELMGTELLGDGTESAPALGELDKLDAILSAVGADDEGRAAITVRLQTLLLKWTEGAAPVKREGVADLLEAATPDELFAFIDGDLTDLNVNSRPDNG
jgi:acyl carrier protein